VESQAETMHRANYHCTLAGVLDYSRRQMSGEWAVKGSRGRDQVDIYLACELAVLAFCHVNHMFW
jgi:hypothetical protein